MKVREYKKMETFDIIICDDDVAFAEKLCGRVKDIAAANGCGVNIAMRHNAGELTDYCNNNPVDIILTDIDMPDEESWDMDFVNIEGFKAVQRLQQQRKDIKIVFVSWHEEYAYRSFEFKPYSFVSKRNPETRLAEVLNELFDLFKSRRASKQWVHLTVGSKNYSIDVNNTLYFKKEKNYIEEYSFGRLLSTYRCSISDAYEQLSDAYYILVHRSYLINCRYIKFFDRYHVVLSNDLKINVSRDKAVFDAAKQIYMKYKRSLR